MKRLSAVLACATLTLGVAVPVGTSSAVETPATALQEVQSWTPLQLANEVIAVSAEATTIASMKPAASAGYGALMLFGTKGLATTGPVLSDLQKASPNGLLVMTDEEGGGVMRLSNLLSPIPWAQRMGATMTSSQVFSEGGKVGAQLRALGVNTDLAPVLDIDGRAIEPGASDPDGFRSFGGSLSRVEGDGVAFMQGLQGAGVVSVVKHFPGLGGASGNTDFGPASTLSLASLQKGGLRAFQAAINAGADAVMMSNASVPGLTTLPASLSPFAVTYLRTTMNFQGLIVTDSLGAGAISALHLSVAAASVAALEAGDDLIIYGTPKSVTQSLAQAQTIARAIVAAVSSGQLPLSTLQAAASQVLATYQSLGTHEVASPSGA